MRSNSAVSAYQFYPINNLNEPTIEDFVGSKMEDWIGSQPWELSTNIVQLFGGFLLSIFGMYMRRKVNQLQLQADNNQFFNQRPMMLPQDPRDEVIEMEVENHV